MYCKAFYQYAATVTGLLSVLSCGLNIAWPSPSLPLLLRQDSQIPITSSQGPWIATINIIGSTFGSIFGVYLITKVGRKGSILLSSPLYFGSWIVVAFASSVLMLLLARFVAGFADGFSNMSMGMYIGEIAEPNIRGMLSTLHPIILVLGTLIINFIGSYYSIKTTALMCACVPVLNFVSFYWMPESPYYLLMKGKVEEARKSLQTFRRSLDVESELDRVKKAIHEQSKSDAKLLDLFTVKSNRRATIIGILLVGGAKLCGASAIMNYLQIIFQEVGGKISVTSSSMIYVSVKLVMCIVPSLYVDKIGRKPLLEISTTGASVFLAAEGLYFYFKNVLHFDLSDVTYLPLTFLAVFSVFFSMGLSTIPPVIMGELYPTNVKPLAFCFVNICLCVLVVYISKFFQVMTDIYGMHIPFFAYSVGCVFTLLVVIFVVPETKQKTLEEIQEDLKKGQDK